MNCSCFNVHSKVRAESKEEAERVSKYMIRPVLSLRRLSLDEAKGQVIYQYGKHSGETEHMDYLSAFGHAQAGLEFVARLPLISLIKDKLWSDTTDSMPMLTEER